ncbi:MAG: hypothetical protein D6831_00975 [Aquificota bacterium]|nr:MAG: hypothetical protein D6831_00975 [Aquificota bacterium]
MIEIIQKFKKIVASVNIVKYDIEPIGYRFHAEIYFINGFKLIVRDYQFEDKRKYSFNWLDRNDKMIIRWGNVVQWNGSEDTAFKKHMKEKVEPYFKVFFEDILSEIEKYITGKS